MSDAVRTWPTCTASPAGASDSRTEVSSAVAAAGSSVSAAAAPVVAARPGRGERLRGLLGPVAAQPAAGDGRQQQGQRGDQ